MARSGSRPIRTASATATIPVRIGVMPQRIFWVISTWVQRMSWMAVSCGGCNNCNNNTISPSSLSSCSSRNFGCEQDRQKRPAAGNDATSTVDAPSDLTASAVARNRKTFYYRVLAFNDTAQSDGSNTASVTTP